MEVKFSETFSKEDEQAYMYDEFLGLKKAAVIALRKHGVEVEVRDSFIGFSEPMKPELVILTKTPKINRWSALASYGSSTLTDRDGNEISMQEEMLLANKELSDFLNFPG